jgi:hypothetical protein
MKDKDRDNLLHAYHTARTLHSIYRVIKSLIGWNEHRLSRKEYRALEKREAAISAAWAALPKAESLDYANGEGRYSFPHAIPRNLPLQFMTDQERHRHLTKVGEFSDLE